MMVEDHPFDYKDFEGVIPEGNYGAGSVIIWDRGFYHHPSAKDRKESEKLLLDGLRKGDMKFVLEGEKLQGEFALVKTRRDEKSWLLLKKKDRYAIKEDILKENRSVVSNKTLEDVSEAKPEKSSRQKKINQIRLREAMEREDLKDAPVKPMPHGIKPMLATLVKEPFDHPDWIFEVKWDGYRAIAEIRDGDVSLYSRNRISLNQKFLPITDSLRNLGFEAVLDGEIVAVDDQGHPDFQMLQNYRKSGKGHLLYYVFDLLHFQGHDLTNLPLLRRKELLKKILPSSPKIKFSDHVVERGRLVFQCRQRKGTRGDHRQTFSKRVPDGQKEPPVAEGEDAAYAGGRDRRIHGTERGQKIFRHPCPRRLRRGRVDLHRSFGRRIRGEKSEGNPRKNGSPDPEKNAPLKWSRRPIPRSPG